MFQETKSRIPQYVGFRLLRQLPGSLATYSNSTKSLAGTNMWFDDIYNNATAVNAPYGVNWVQNTDGFDTMDVNNIKLTNMVYQGG